MTRGFAVYTMSLPDELKMVTESLRESFDAAFAALCLIDWSLSHLATYSATRTQNTEREATGIVDVRLGRIFTK